MPGYVLYHGNRNYSSWSMRAWLAMKLAGIEFDAVAFHLGEPGVRDRIREHSPTGRVPVLRHDELIIWDSLAIGEYMAERAPEAGLWPARPDARAVARSVCAEMHSSFQALRAHMPMNIRRSSPGKGRAPGVEEDIDRVCEVWNDCRSRHGEGGAFLFGAYCLADVFFAPVVSRFNTYDVDLDRVSRSYASAVWEQPDVREWRRAAEAEEWVESEFDL